MSDLEGIQLTGEYDKDCSLITHGLNSNLASHQSFKVQIDGLVDQMHTVRKVDALEREVAVLKEVGLALERSVFDKLNTIEKTLVTTIERQKAFAGKVILVGAFLQIILTSAIGTAIAYIMKG